MNDAIIGLGHSNTVKPIHHQDKGSQGRYISGILVTRLLPYTCAAQAATQVYRETGFTVR